MRKSFSGPYIKKSIGLMLISCGIVLLLISQPMNYVRGLILGGVVGALLFRQMEITLIQAMDRSEEGAKKYTTAHYGIRYLLYGLVLVAAAKTPHIDFFATVIGLFFIKLVIYGDNIYKLNFSKRGGRGCKEE